MSILESIYCYLQYEKIKEGKPVSYDVRTGNTLTALSLVMLIFGAFFWIITISPDAADTMEDFLKAIFGRTVGKAIGQFLMIFLLAIAYPIIIKTIGTQDNFERITEAFLKMPQDEQEKIAKKGSTFFIFSIIFMIVPIFLKAILG